MSTFNHPQPGPKPTGTPYSWAENNKVLYLGTCLCQQLHRGAIVRFSYTFPCIAMFESDLLIKYEKFPISQTSQWWSKPNWKPWPPQNPSKQCGHRSFWRRKAVAQKRGFIFTNYSQLINVKQNQSERIHLSNYIQVKLCGVGSRKGEGWTSQGRSPVLETCLIKKGKLIIKHIMVDWHLFLMTTVGVPLLSSAWKKLRNVLVYLCGILLKWWTNRYTKWWHLNHILTNLIQYYSTTLSFIWINLMTN